MTNFIGNKKPIIILISAVMLLVVLGFTSNLHLFDSLNFSSSKKVRTSLELQKKFPSVTIPEGFAIIGDESNDDPQNTHPAKKVYISLFSIGIYEITNDQYATWLTEALKKELIALVEIGENRGQVLDMEGNLLFKTFAADPYSQIASEKSTKGRKVFKALPGRGHHPVISVSWYGAVAYCKDNNCRLPTEAEWEKAAGMQPETDGSALKKFRFGFGSDTIDETFANYRTTDQPLKTFKVMTSPVGFYNGTNLLPLTRKNSKQTPTHDAKSPYGLYDMSGNVWEWVSDWYSDAYTKEMDDNDPQGPSEASFKGNSQTPLKVVKGGCYDSLPDGVRVSERLGLDKEHTDAYTGFRIAL